MFAYIHSVIRLCIPTWLCALGNFLRVFILAQSTERGGDPLP